MVQELFRSQYPAAAGKTVWQRVASGEPSRVQDPSPGSGALMTRGENAWPAFATKR